MHKSGLSYYNNGMAAHEAAPLTPDTILVATGKTASWLGPSEGFILSQLREPLSVTELESVAPLAPSELHMLLTKMLRGGVLVDARARRLETGTAMVESIPIKKRKQPLPPASREEQFLRRLQFKEQEIAGDDLYEVLGLAAGAPVDKVKDAFHQLSLVFHPDRIPRALVEDASVMDRVEAVWNMLREAAAVLGDDERRREWARALRDRRVGKDRKDPVAENKVQSRINRDGVKLETLLAMVQTDLKKLETKGAMTTLRIARRIDPENKTLEALQGQIEATHKIQMLLDKAALAGIMTDYERKRIARALRENGAVISGHRELQGRVFRFLCDHDVDLDLARELYHKIASGKMNEAEYIAGIEMLVKLKMARAALDLAEKAMGSYAGNERIRELIKITKKQIR